MNPTPTQQTVSPASGMDEMQQLKALLMAAEHGALVSIQGQVEEIADPDFLSQSLPNALTNSHHTSSKELAEALQEPLVEAIQLGATTNRKSLSSALFPILGPAIRLYVSDTFKSMFEQLNENIRSATSINRVKWWVEAKLSGKEFSEYVMLKTLNFRIENLMLVCPESGLLLQQVSRLNEEEENPELISSMLIAIRSFVRDSFANDAQSNEELGRFSFGEKDIYLESGPKAILAAVSVGNPPPSYREQMGKSLETIHAVAAAELENFNGDPDTLSEKVVPEIIPLLQENQNKKEEKSSGWRGWLLLGLIGAVIVAFVAMGVRNSVYANRLTSAVKLEPGVEIISLKHYLFRKNKVSILRDPLAADAASLLKSAKVPAKWCQISETAILSQEEPFATRRRIEVEVREQALQEAHQKDLSELHQQLENLLVFSVNREEQIEHQSVEIDGLHSQLENLAGVTISRDDYLSKEAGQLEYQQQNLASLHTRIEELQKSSVTRSEHLEMIRGDFFQRFPIESAVELIHLGNNKWALKGEVSEPWYSSVTESETTLLIGGGSLSLDEFKRLGPDPETMLKSEIEAICVEFYSATAIPTPAGDAAMGLLFEQLNQWAELRDQKALQVPAIELHATPIIGNNQYANRIIATQRLDSVKAALQKAVPRYIDLSTIYDETKTRASSSSGVYINTTDIN